MSKQMTPCEELGYKAGDKFKVVDGAGAHYAVGSFITLIHDDGSLCPRFNGVHAIYGSGDSFFPLDFVEKVAKLKPAKQALADAIHQNGGWSVAGDCNFATSNRSGVVKFFNQNPLRNGADWVSCPYSLSWIDLHQQLPNWHQCILSRDEYFTAYPEQPKDEVMSKDWHKNGELPPVGEVCIFSPPPCSEYYFPDSTLKAKGKEVLIIAHTRFNRAVGDVAVMKWDFGDSGGVCSANRMCFIPLLTERDKAIDEMVDVICHNGFLSCDGTESKKIAERLLDAGYRKEVK